MNPVGPKPIVAIIGRPNVGKSTLFNRLVGRRMALVHDEPGVTRDRHYADAQSRGLDYTLIDTGGFDPEGDDEMQHGIRQQIELALRQADVILCILDGAAPPTAMDEAALGRLRRTELPVLYIANKCDSDRAEADAMDLYRLGVDEILLVSALHGRGMAQLEQELAGVLKPLYPPVHSAPEGTTADDDPAARDGAETEEGREASPVLRVAVVGRPNAGKSSLINRLLDEERLLVDAEPGTTRDPIDAPLERRGRRYVLVDTAGLRRKGQVARGGDAVEAMSVVQGIRSMDRAEIVVLVCDAHRGVAEQDAKILGLAIDRGRGIVVALNKTDLLTRDTLQEAKRQARETLAFAPWAPIQTISALNGRGTGKLLEAVAAVSRSYGKRVTTGELNRFMDEVLSNHPPPVRGGRAPRFYYVTQAETAPPLFVVQTSHPKQIHFSYERYVINAIRKRFGFEGAPIRLRFRRADRRPDRRRRSR